MSDPSAATPPRLVHRLAAALTETLGVKPFDDAGALLGMTPDSTTARSAVTAGLTIEPRLQIQEHHDIAPGILIHDPYLGVIGLVDVMKDDADSVKEQIEELIDRAAYLRQLCLLNAERTGTLAQTVELVLVFGKEHSRKDTVDATTPILRNLAKETGYLRALGVSLLFEPPDGRFTRGALRRAFPWLLHAARQWYAVKRVQQHATDGVAVPWTVKLTEYRHAGDRTYQFDGTTNFHVLHGYNGSGKSTLTEAVELLLTHSIERLDDAHRTRYFPIVRYARPGRSAHAPERPSDTPAVVALTMGAADERVEASVTIVKEPPEVASPAADVIGDRLRTWNGKAAGPRMSSAASFRLDQVLMDKLIRSSEADRASLFLRAFFPEDEPKFEARDKAARDAKEAFDKLPASLQSAAPNTDDRPAVIHELLQWTQQTPSAWTSGVLNTIAACLPVSPSQLEVLAALEPLLRSTLQKWRDSPSAIESIEQELHTLDRALSAIQSKATAARRDVETALGIFTDFSGWRASRQVDRGENFQKALDAWLELQALADLAAKYYEVAATLAAARARGWTARPEHEPLFEAIDEDTEAIERLRSKRDELARARDEARAVVHDWTTDPSPTGAAAERAGQSRPPRLHLTAAEVQSLNTIGTWLPSAIGDQSAPGLGDVFMAALQRDDTRTYGKIIIGRPNGYDSAIAEAQQLAEALRALESAPGVVETFRNCTTALAAFDALAAQRHDATLSFFGQLARPQDGEHLLIGALNELLALFKPAPWAYPDITLRAAPRTEGGDVEELGIRTGDDAPAELRLNTAEMNTFTVSLFMLCAPALPNPLRLLVLDDPLQNMDEMTVSSLARGFGRLMRIFPRGWRVLALFHGEEDLHRIREEVPTAVYRLPWLSPTAVADRRPISAQPSESTASIQLQRVEDLVTVDEQMK